MLVKFSLTLPAVTWKLPASLLSVRAPCTLQASLGCWVSSLLEEEEEYSLERSATHLAGMSE